MKVIEKAYRDQLSQQFGDDVARELLLSKVTPWATSPSTTSRGGYDSPPPPPPRGEDFQMQDMPYSKSSSSGRLSGLGHVKYDSVEKAGREGLSM